MATSAMGNEEYLDDLEDDEVCPTCIEPYDKQDKKFFPCPCNYRVCMFCVRRIQTEFDGRCPGCRRDYSEKDFRFEDAQDESKRNRRDNGSRGTSDFVPHTRRGKGGVQSNDSSGGSNSKANGGRVTDRRRLANVRVIQRNLVYLIGLAPTVARDEILRRPEYFGQYGKIVKVVVKFGYVANQNRVASASAYITYSKEEDAKLAIMAVDNFLLEGHMIRASYGTTKYCNMFLRGLSCNNPECLYLHKLGEDSASFTKEEMQSIGKNQFHDMTHIYSADGNGVPRKHTGILPPRGAVGSQWVETANGVPQQAGTAPPAAAPGLSPPAGAVKRQTSASKVPHSPAPAGTAPLPAHAGWAAVASTAPKKQGIGAGAVLPGAPTNTLGAALTVASKLPKNKGANSRKGGKSKKVTDQPSSKPASPVSAEPAPVAAPTAQHPTGLPEPSPVVPNKLPTSTTPPLLFSPASLDFGGSFQKPAANFLGANLLQVPGSSRNTSEPTGGSLLSSLGGMELSEYETQQRSSGGLGKSLAPGGEIRSSVPHLAPGFMAPPGYSRTARGDMARPPQLPSVGLPPGMGISSGNIPDSRTPQPISQPPQSFATKEEWTRSMLAMPASGLDRSSYTVGSGMHTLSRPGTAPPSAGLPPGISATSLPSGTSLSLLGGGGAAKQVSGLSSSGGMTRMGGGSRPTLARPPPQQQFLYHQQRQHLAPGPRDVSNGDSALYSSGGLDSNGLGFRSGVDVGANNATAMRRGVIGPVSNHVVSSATGNLDKLRGIGKESGNINGNMGVNHMDAPPMNLQQSGRGGNGKVAGLLRSSSKVGKTKGTGRGNSIVM